MLCDSIKNGNRQGFFSLVDTLCSYAENEKEKKKIMEGAEYILSNWSAAKVRLKIRILDIPKERFACLYETPADNGDVTVPPGVIAALNTFADALSMVKSNMWGGNSNDRDSDN